MKTTIPLLCAFVFTLLPHSASASSKILVDSTEVIPQGEKVIVGKNEITSTILEEKNYSRYDRGLRNHLFIPRRTSMIGLTASYNEFSTDDIQILSVIKDLDFNVHVFSFKPSYSYFFSDNQSIGARLSVSNGSAELSSLTVDFDEDINFDLVNVKYNYSGFGTEIFHRRYIGLSQQRRFGIFNETALVYNSSKSEFQRSIDSTPRITKTSTNKIELNFSPGLT